MEAYMPFLLWAGLFVLTVLVEFATQQLVSIWFAAGGLFCPRWSWPTTLLVSSN